MVFTCNSSCYTQGKGSLYPNKAHFRFKCLPISLICYKSKFNNHKNTGMTLSVSNISPGNSE